MARWLKRDSSLGFALQGDYTTEQTENFIWALVGEDVSVDLARDLQTVQLLEGTVGASSAPLVGSRHGGKVKFRVPLRSLKVGYAPTSDDIALKVPPEFTLLCTALGGGADNEAYTAAYQAAAIGTGSAGANVVTAAAITHVVGQFFASAASNGSGLATGWIKSKSGTPETLVLNAAPVNSPANGHNSYPTAVAALTGEPPIPLTIRYVGSNAKHALVLVGCVCESLSLSLDARQVPMLELSYTFTSHRRDATAGGLQVPVAFERVQPCIGLQGAKLLIGGVTTPGIGDLKVEYTNELAYVDSHAAPQGVAECVVTGRKIKVSCSVPIDSEDALTNGSSPYETKLENGTVTSLCLTTGTAIGKIASIYLPSLRVSAQPKLADKGGFLVEQVEFEGAPMTSDGTAGSTDASPADTILRIALA